MNCRILGIAIVLVVVVVSGWRVEGSVVPGGPVPMGISREGTESSVWNIVHITDVHGWIFGHPHNETLNADFGDFLSLSEHTKALAKQAGEEYFIFDTGDLIEGTGMSDATPTHGQCIYPVAAQIPYDGLTVGNHDLAAPSAVTLLDQTFVPVWLGRYVACNTFVLDSPSKNHSLGTNYQIVTTDLGHSVLLLGFIYDFTHQASNSYVQPVDQALLEPWFAEAMSKANTVDLIIVLAHIDPQAPPEMDQIYTAIRGVHPKMPMVMLGGHRHKNYFNWYDDNCFVLESLCYFMEIGTLRFKLNENHQIQDLEQNWVPTSLENFYSLSKTTKDTFSTPAGLKLKTKIQSYWDQLDLGHKYGVSPDTFDPTIDIGQPHSFYDLFINKIVPKVIWPLGPKDGNVAFFVCNTASLRYPLFEGTVVKNDIVTVAPFNDSYLYVSGVKGDQLNAFLANLSQHFEFPFRDAPYERPEGRSSNGIGKFAWSGDPVDPTVMYDLVGFEYDITVFASILEEMFPSQSFPTVKFCDMTDSSTLVAYIESVWPSRN